VAARIVDGLEVIEIDEQQSNPSVAVGIGQNVLERSHRAGAIEAARQLVGDRSPFEGVAESGRLGDIGDAHHPASDLSVFAERCTNRPLQVPDGSIARDVIDDEPRCRTVVQERVERCGQGELLELTVDRAEEHLVRVEWCEKFGESAVGVLDSPIGIELGHPDGQRLGEEADEFPFGDQGLGRGNLERDVVEVEAHIADAIGADLVRDRRLDPQ
jgi:hypothetical protein